MRNIYLFLFLIENILNYIVIPFKTHHSLNNKNEEYYNSSDFIKEYYSNKIYFPIEVGSPPKEIAFILITTTSGLNFGYSICPHFYFSDLPITYLEYSYENSTTYNLTSKNLKEISNTLMGSQSTESFKFYTDISKKESNHIIVNNLPFIYISKDDAIKIYNDGTICGLIGLALFERESFRETYNLINLLKKKDVIDNYYFNYAYNKNNNEEGILIVGEQPHNYNPKMFNEVQLRTEYSIGEHFELVWGVMFNSIYFFDKDNKKVSMTDIKYAQFIPELYCIKGTLSYKKIIEEQFFNSYINKNICRIDMEPLKLFNQNSRNFYIINCDINPEFKIETFPTLYFLHKKFNYTFELDYKDLFIKKGNKYFFMAVFPYSYVEHFEMGKIFLKKYFFTYNIDRKTINFYNPNIPFETKKEDNIKIYIIIVGIIILIVSCLVGFYFGRKIFEKTRNKRNYELDEEYEYSLNH